MSDDLEFENLKSERVELLTRLNEEAFSYCYHIQNETTQAIVSGDIEQLNNALQSIDSDKMVDQLIYSNQGDLLEHFKFLLININTYSRIAANNGGVLPLYLHLISERFIALIEITDDLDYLKNEVFFMIFKEYCIAVSQFSTLNYSPVMVEIVKYITEHLTSNLSLKYIAENFGMHPVHLARKFKQETGKTFINYINLQRTYLAKYYFHLGKYQLNEVACLSGFNSHSYFTKVFKKITGETPTMYIKKLPKK